MAASYLEGRDLLARARSRLQSVLGGDWEIVVESPGELLSDDLDPIPEPDGFDEVWVARPRRSTARPARLVVDAKTAVTPSTALRTAAIKPALLARLKTADALLLVAPWLSPRSRELLEDQGVNYLDLTGNVSINLRRPPIIIRTDGAQQSPAPERRGQRGLSGPRAARLVRELVDIAPPRPWQASELVDRTGLSQGYVSRLLDVMVDQALIRREGRLIVDVDWAGLLRARASTYQLMRTGHHVPVVARRGRNRLLEELAAGEGRHQVVVTGSYVAEQVAPLAIGGPLMLYVPAGPHVIEETAKDLGLLRTDQALNPSLRGADVIVMQPSTDLPMLRPQIISGVNCVAYSQLVLDCLSGPGRMPAEGEAVLSWMQDNMTAWRIEPDLAGRAPGRRHVEGP